MCHFCARAVPRGARDRQSFSAIALSPTTIAIYTQAQLNLLISDALPTLTR